MRFLIFLPLFLLLNLLGCQSDETTSELNEVPIFTPGEIIQFDSAGEYYFSHLGYGTVVLNDGSVLIPDRTESKLFKVGSSGELLDVAASGGRGPGEVQDITFISKSAHGGVLVYDQGNKKTIFLNENGNYVNEILFPSWESSNMSEIFELNDQYFLLTFQSFDYLSDPEKEPTASLVLYDRDQNTYTGTRSFAARPYAITFRDGASVGGRRVPFTAADIHAYDQQSGKFYLFRSDKNQIAQIDHILEDTLQTIIVDFNPEPVSNTELREIREDMDSESWKAMQELLPEYKALADDMLIDHQQNFWLKLNHSGELQQWLVISTEGEFLQRVQLPEDAMLTHISKHHLGVRLNDVTFAFFEPVNL
ncbi:MAG: hypothetical protein WEA56_02120 [Balneolaceae bacterium]